MHRYWVICSSILSVLFIGCLEHPAWHGRSPIKLTLHLLNARLVPDSLVIESIKTLLQLRETLIESKLFFLEALYYMSKVLILSG
jgi:hypothetical protein